jgi:large subunit ribosomal protein L25
MKSIEVVGTQRSEFGKKAVKAIRKTNAVPCIVYGVDKDENGNPVAKSFTVKYDGLRKLIYTPNIYIVNLTVDGVTVEAIMKEVQFHPVTDRILHVDFYQIDETKPIVMEVPIALEGLAAGVKAGGKINQVIRKLRVRALYNIIPEKLSVNVTDLALGKAIKVGELDFENLQILNAKNAVVCAVKTTRAAQTVDTPVAAATATTTAAVDAK